MNRVMIGAIIMLLFQFCTSELNEIDGVIGDHIDGNIPISNRNTLNNIPTDSFLGQYFSNDSNTPISSRIENRIRHDFNSPIREDVDDIDLGAKWTGNFYFESGNYVFTVNSE